MMIIEWLHRKVLKGFLGLQMKSVNLQYSTLVRWDSHTSQELKICIKKVAQDASVYYSVVDDDDTKPNWDSAKKNYVC